MRGAKQAAGVRPEGRPIRSWALALLAVLIATGASAHNLGQSYLYLQIYEDTVTGRFEIALSDLNPALGLAGTEAEIVRISSASAPNKATPRGCRFRPSQESVRQ